MTLMSTKGKQVVKKGQNPVYIVFERPLLLLILIVIALVNSHQLGSCSFPSEEMLLMDGSMNVIMILFFNGHVSCPALTACSHEGSKKLQLFITITLESKIPFKNIGVNFSQKIKAPISALEDGHFNHFIPFSTICTNLRKKCAPYTIQAVSLS